MIKGSKESPAAVRPVTALQLYRNNLDATTTAVCHQNQNKNRNNSHQHQYDCHVNDTKNQGRTEGPLSLYWLLSAPVIPMLLQIPKSNTGGGGGGGEEGSSLPKWLYLGPTTGRVTEIVGEAGTGKTQLCLSLCVSLVLLPIMAITSNDTDCISSNHDEKVERRTRKRSLLEGNNVLQVSKDLQPESGSSQQQKNHSNHDVRLQAIYVCMGDSAGVTASQIAKRLHQMTRARWRSTTTNKDKRENENNHDVQNILQRIQTKCIYNTEQLLEFLHDLPIQLEQEHAMSVRTGLIVLDSIANLYRIQEDGSFHDQYFYSNRSRDLFYISSRLKKISNQYGINIVVVNQVTMNGKGRNVPCLGLSWSCCVNERYMLDRDSRKVRDGNSNYHSNRKDSHSGRNIHLLSSCQYVCCPNVSIAFFEIEECGVVQS